MNKQLMAMEMLFKALADRTRLRILGLLLAGEVCVCDLQDSLKSPQSKVSRHLAYLRRVGLVETRRKGLWVHYRLATLGDPVQAAIVDAVGHALTHTEIVQRDGVRLKKRTGCCPPTPAGAPRAACCEPDSGVATRA
jgi:ArsR family transcriptional regulator, arsenate/arsenite/antimonite-responsive transcriptional repressor